MSELLSPDFACSNCKKKDAEIDYEIPLEDIREAVLDNVGLVGNPT